METCTLTGHISGDGPPLVILHGLFGSGRNWASIARAFATDYQVHCLDLRNHGASPWTERMDYRLMAADVQAYLDGHALPPCAVLGHSMGGKAAMLLALESPHVVGRLIVVDIAPVPYRHDENGAYAAALRALPLAGKTRRADVDALLAPAVPDPTIRAFLMQNLESHGDGGFRWRLNLEAIVNSMPALVDFPAVESSYTGPVTFIAGERSDYIRPRDEPSLRHYFPQSRLVEIGECGHWPHAERPDRFLQLVREALNEQHQSEI